MFHYYIYLLYYVYFLAKYKIILKGFSKHVLSKFITFHLTSLFNYLPSDLLYQIFIARLLFTFKRHHYIEHIFLFVYFLNETEQSQTQFYARVSTFCYHYVTLDINSGHKRCENLTACRFVHLGFTPDHNLSPLIGLEQQTKF